MNSLLHSIPVDGIDGLHGLIVVRLRTDCGFPSQSAQELFAASVHTMNKKTKIQVWLDVILKQCCSCVYDSVDCQRYHKG